MKYWLTLGFLAMTAMSAMSFHSQTATCIAYANDCGASIILSYDVGEGEICYSDSYGDEASLTVYDANGNIVQSVNFRCPDVFPGPPIVDPC